MNTKDGRMNIKKVVIFGPSIQQRVVKTAYSFLKMGFSVSIYAEENAVKGEFDNYLDKIEYVQLPVTQSKLRRTPFGRQREKFIKRIIDEIGAGKTDTLILSRDVNYGYIVGKIIKKANYGNIFFVLDVADNYDLLYDSYMNPIKRAVYRIGFEYITKNAFNYCAAALTVCPINVPRLRDKFSKQLENKPIIILRNLPIEFHYIDNPNKIPHSFVYVGKIDEVSRDPLYVLDQLAQLPDYTLHFYSSQKKDTLDKIRSYAEMLNISDRVIFHSRVPYDALAAEISQYRFGLVPHKRSLITDYTLPNKMYDYKSSGVISIMSDCPSLVKENREFAFGLNYSKENDDFVEIIKEAETFVLETTIHVPSWEESFRGAIEELIP